MARRAGKRTSTKRADSLAPGDLVHRPFAGIAPKPARSARRPEPPPPPPRPAKTAGTDEAETFAAYMAGVRALESPATRIPATSDSLPRGAERVPPASDLDATARARLSSLVAEHLRFEVTDDGEHVEGRRIDVDPRDLRRLRRGELAIDGKLDLHERTVAEARAAVDAFVKKRRADGDRVVVIVHGRGVHSPRGMAVLRGEIGAWLSQGAAARHVAAFTSLPDQTEGGPGAVWVLLTRKS